jgi:Tol biopolymer transport system component
MRLTSVLLIAVAARVAGAQAGADAIALSRRIQYWNPVWSPDGGTILFESTLHGPSSIYVINADGTNLRRLTTDTSANYQPNWSPDGRRIVFSSDRDGHAELYLMNADGSGVMRLTRMGSGGWYQASFSPDGRRIAFQGRPDNRLTRDRVFVIHVDGSGLRQLTDSAYAAEGPRWSADGSTIRFTQVPYPQRFWREMQEADMQRAKAAQRTMSVRPDGSGLAPAATTGAWDTTWSRDGSRGFFVATRDGIESLFEVRRGDTAARHLTSTNVVPAGFEPSADGRLLVYGKSSGGYAALYTYDVASRIERLLTGGAAAGPLGYLRTTTLTASLDTFDTFTSPRTGGSRIAGGTSYVRELKRVGAQRWELSDLWIDSGRVTTRQSVRSADGSLATEIETVRADRDSASLLIAPTRVTAWVVPEGEAARLFDGPPAGERYAATFVVAAIARSKPVSGATFLAPVAGLFSANPLISVVDTFRVTARDTVMLSGRALPVLVVERNSSTRYWVEEATGVQVAARGNAGPQRWWWHIRRGIRLPDE